MRKPSVPQGRSDIVPRPRRQSRQGPSCPYPFYLPVLEIWVTCLKRDLRPAASSDFQLTARCLRAQALNELLQRGRAKNPRELRPIISNNADVIDHRVVDHPLATGEMELVFDSYRSPFAANNPRVDFCRCSVHAVAVVDYFFASIDRKSTRLNSSHMSISYA